MSIEVMSPRPADVSPRYDRWTICLHWLSAFLIIALFASAYVWDDLPRGTPLRKTLQSVHISMGILFSVVFVVRIFWRTTGGRKLATLETGLQRILSKSLHHLLYLLLAAQVVLGYIFRWTQGEPFMFFGLFSIPNPLETNKDLSHWFGWLHNYAGWTIIIIAFGHAVAALAHHYWLRDGVLRRMLPAGR